MDTNAFTVVPGHFLVSYKSASSCKVCRKKAFYAPNIANFKIFSRHPVELMSNSWLALAWA